MKLGSVCTATSTISGSLTASVLSACSRPLEIRGNARAGGDAVLPDRPELAWDRLWLSALPLPFFPFLTEAGEGEAAAAFGPGRGAGGKCSSGVESAIAGVGSAAARLLEPDGAELEEVEGSGEGWLSGK